MHTTAGFTFKLVDSDVIPNRQISFATDHYTAERPAIPKFQFRHFVPAAAACNGHGDSRGHRAYERRIGEAIAEFNVKVKMVADIGDRNQSHSKFSREFYQDFLDRLSISKE